MMDELTHDLNQKLMISAFTKVDRIQKYNRIGEVTLGPNSIRNSPQKEDNSNNQITNRCDNTTEYVATKNGVFCNYTYFNHNGLPVRHILREYETQRQEECKNALGARLNKIEQFRKMQETQRKQTQMKQYQELLENEQRQENLILNSLEQYDKKMLNDQTKLMQQFQDAAARRRNQELALEAKDRQKQLLNSYVDKIKKSQLEFRGTVQQILGAIKSVQDSVELKKVATEDVQMMKTLNEEVDGVINVCKTGKISEEEVNKSAEAVIKIKIIKERIDHAVQTINEKFSKNESEKTEEKQRIENQHQTENNKQMKIQTNIDNATTQNTRERANSHLEQIGNISDIKRYVSLNNLQSYTEIMSFLENHTASFRELSQDVALKQFKFDCKKAINIPVNALSGINSEHILDKYRRLHALLSGGNVVVGDRQFNASKHPQGIAFCMDLLAKKLVLQGDLMVSSNPESAFCYASVTVSLWNDFPIFGKLLLAYFYKTCPYLVPFYLPREVGESDEDYYIKRGYQYTDGQIEKQDKFLKRMTGIMRLFAAIMIAKPKRGQTTSPYNLKNGWIWLASLLKLEPDVDITATMLHTFLETVGFEMDARYGRIFQKVLRIIVETFLPQCKAKCTGGAVTRLELMFTEYLKNGRFEKPNGYMEYPYW